MKIRLSKTEKDYLKSNFSEFSKDIKHILNTSSLTINIEDVLADKIRDKAGEKLQLVGFDKDYNLTKEGEILENLIDKLYH